MSDGICSQEELYVLKRLWGWEDEQERERFFSDWLDKAQHTHKKIAQRSSWEYAQQVWRRMQSVMAQLFPPKKPKT